MQRRPRVMSRNRENGDEIATNVWRAINFYGPHTHIYRRRFSSLIRDRKQNARICRCAVYAGVSFPPFFFFVSFFFFFLIVIHCAAAIHLMLSPACVQFDISPMERSRYFVFLFPPPPPPSNYYNRRVPPPTTFYAIDCEPTSGFAYKRESDYLFGRV